jgi:membrane protein required for beta-lactamase induction
MMMKRLLNSEGFTNFLAVLFWVVVIGGIVALILWTRHSAPCWIFPLAEAPTRCLPGAVR